MTPAAPGNSGLFSSFASGPKPDGISELLYQIQRSVSFLWASGGCFSDFYIHHEILDCQHEFAPEVDKLTMDSPAPLQLGPDGRYPVPQPGITTRREY